MILACIVAGGTGSRMGLDRPKQFIEIGGRPIIVRTLEQFLEVDEIDRVYIGAHADWVEHTKGLIAEYGLDESRVCVLPGGSDRNETVMRCAGQAKEDFPEGEHIFLTHDGVRPFVTEQIIRENIEACKRFGAVGTYIQAVDTVIISESGETVDRTPERRTVYQAQTPQTFMLGKLIDAYASLNEEQKAELTDTCSVITQSGGSIHIAMGDRRNIKITTISDLDIAKALL